MFRFLHKKQPQVEHSNKEYGIALAALKTKILALYAQVKDPTQQVLFVASMIPPRGPEVFHDAHQGAGLQVLDFPGMTNGRFNAIETGVFDPADGTVVDAGGNKLPVPGPNVLPYGDLLKLVAQGQAMHGDV